MKKLSAKQKKELDALAALPDSEIDLSDVPEIRELPANYPMGKFYRPIKQSVSIRIDADVLAWLKSDGEGYQTRINDYLRQLMNSSKRRRRST